MYSMEKYKRSITERLQVQLSSEIGQSKVIQGKKKAQRQKTLNIARHRDSKTHIQHGKVQKKYHREIASLLQTARLGNRTKTGWKKYTDIQGQKSKTQRQADTEKASS
jgi:hypothetical protein